MPYHAAGAVLIDRRQDALRTALAGRIQRSEGTLPQTPTLVTTANVSRARSSTITRAEGAAATASSYAQRLRLGGSKGPVFSSRASSQRLRLGGAFQALPPEVLPVNAVQPPRPSSIAPAAPPSSSPRTELIEDWQQVYVDPFETAVIARGSPRATQSDTASPFTIERVRMFNPHPRSGAGLKGFTEDRKQSLPESSATMDIRRGNPAATQGDTLSLPMDERPASWRPQGVPKGAVSHDTSGPMISDQTQRPQSITKAAAPNDTLTLVTNDGTRTPSSPRTTERVQRPRTIRSGSLQDDYTPKTTSASTAARPTSDHGKAVRRSFSAGSFATKEHRDYNATMLTMSELPAMMGLTDDALGGKFTIRRILGRGTSATVWEAHHIETQEQRAIKVFDKCRNDWVNATSKQASREARIMGSLEHPCIIRLLETFETDVHFCMVCEFANGGSLRQVLRQQASSSFEECQARLLFAQACDAVQYLHSKNIAHRDIKLENMLLDKRTGRLKLIDFGFAVQMKGKDHKLRFFCGTPSYMAPEIVMSREYSGFAIDVWALGVALYVMMTGQFPFAGNTESQLYAKIRRGAFKCSEVLGDHAKRLIIVTLKVEPQSRPTAAQLLKHPWFDTMKESSTGRN